jgi:two-component system, OmpR family, phosphate regulon sensor histidine kinase PhoR
MSAKNRKELLEEREKLINEIFLLQQRLKEANDSLNAIKSGNIDALVTKDKVLEIFSGNTADKPYRILIENMHEGAVTLNEDGTILYCNSYFANMLKLKLHKIIGTNFIDYIDNISKQNFTLLIQKGLKNDIKDEVNLLAGDGKEIPVLMSLNALPIDNRVVTSIILTDLTIFNENQER